MKPLRLHCLQHVPFEGLGLIADWAKNEDITVSVSRLYAEDALPEELDFDLLFVMGGPMSTYDERKFRWLTAEKKFLERVILKEKTVVGICLGAQLIADVLGARVYPGPEKEIGWFPVEYSRTERTKALFGNFPDSLEVLHWHGDTFDLPESSERVLSSVVYENQAFIYNQNTIGLQCHLELRKEDLSALAVACEPELKRGGPFVQTAEEMLSKSDYFTRASDYCEKFLIQLRTSLDDGVVERQLSNPSEE